MSSRLLVSFLAVCVAAGPVNAVEPLERELVRIAPQVIRHLKSKDYRNVGVLKFLISRDGKKFSDNVGTLNVLLARRLEVALVLANDPRTPLGIIDNATVVAHRIKGANHLTREGRLKLFDALYPLPVGKQEVKPDAFVTGVASVSPNLKTLTISLWSFDHKRNMVDEIADFQASIKPGLLVEIGESFTTRGFFDNDGPPTLEKEKKQQEKVIEKAVEVKKETEKHPGQDPKPLVKMEVRFDGQVVPVEFRGGKAFIREPQEGQKVEFILRRDDSKDRYGVVLKVNGENTLEKQRLPDLQCRRWILDPGDNPMLIDGYQIDDQHKEKFRVLSVTESKDREISYGSDVGTITMCVFRERKGRPRPLDPSDEARESLVVSKGTLLTQPKPGEPDKPENFNALKAQLLADANRGLIGEGEKVVGAVQRVKFEPDPTPVLTLTIVYYHPQDLPE